MKFINLIIMTLLLSLSSLKAQDKLTFTAIENSSYATISKLVLKVAYDRLGIEIHVIDLPAERAIVMSNTGRVDGELYRIKNIHHKYKNLIMVPIEIGILEGMAITKNKSLSIDGWDKLSSHRVCIRRGVKFSEEGTRKYKVRPVTFNAQLFDMLAKNRCDVITIARITSIPLVVSFVKKNNTQLYERVLQTYPLYHYLHKKNAHLLPKLVKVLKNMKKEGLISKIRSEFISKVANASK